jgi:hypothetical protein
MNKLNVPNITSVPVVAFFYRMDDRNRPTVGIVSIFIKLVRMCAWVHVRMHENKDTSSLACAISDS